MNRTEYLLTQAASEAMEFAHRITKALHFGLQEVEPGQSKTNAERAVGEFVDLLAVVEMLADEGHISKPHPDHAAHDFEVKRRKVEKFIEYARTQCGTVEG